MEFKNDNPEINVTEVENLLIGQLMDDMPISVATANKEGEFSFLNKNFINTISSDLNFLKKMNCMMNIKDFVNYYF